ncbi:MAG: formylglycine-generating enzyme family protein [Phycisphaerae bacterium]
MATRQAWAAVVAALFLLWLPGLDSKGSEPNPKEITIQIGENVSMKLALIPAGKFMMGSPDSEQGHKGNEVPQHEVTISKPFYMGVTEVTQAQYEAVMGTNPSDFKGATNPVEMVSWNDATEFCKKLSEKTRQAVRLPTEAEWEYACRAGSKTRFSFGDAEEGLGDYAWYNANSGRATHPVGQRKPNAWGLYDLHGNVWEWCVDWYGDADWYGDYPKGAVTDPQGPASGASRVLRGGAWYYSPNYCRSAYRFNGPPGRRSSVFGFRVVVSVSGSPAAAVPVAAQPAPAAPTVAATADVTFDLGGGVTMKLALIPAGKFMMGEGEDQHEVTISKPFYMGVTEVTQAQYEAVMGTNPSNFQGATNPVEEVSWNDATEFCKKLSEKTRQAVRLPTEAEWEYACRAGTKTAFSFGDADTGLGDYAWYGGNSGNTTHPVGQKKPNAWGLYDMHGNVWEWCADWYGDYPKGAATDPQGPASGASRVLRGGSWNCNPSDCRSANRVSHLFLDSRSSDDGFRVVVSVSAPGL